MRIGRPTRPTGLRPTGAAAIDWSRPITRGMFDCVLWGAGLLSPINLVSGVPTSVTSAPTLSMTAKGAAGYGTGGSSFNVPDHGAIVVGDCTVRVVFLPVSWPSAFTALLDKGSAGPTNREIAIFVGATGNISFVCLGNDPGASIAVATAMTAGSVWDLVLSKSGSTVSYYVNGVLINTGTSAGTGAAPTPMSFGSNPSGGGSNGDIKYIAAQTWKRALSPSEVVELYVNPYGFLAPAGSMVPALRAPAAGFHSRYYYDMSRAA